MHAVYGLINLRSKFMCIYLVEIIFNFYKKHKRIIGFSLNLPNFTFSYKNAECQKSRQETSRQSSFFFGFLLAKSNL
jgi:hypothetical protein